MSFISSIVFFRGTHTDHGVLPQHWGYLQDMAGEHISRCEAEGTGLTPLITTFTLPEGVADTVNALYGPVCGDAPVTEAHMAVRGDRPWEDRMIDLPKRPSRLLSVVAVPEFRDVPEKGRRLVCFTAHGGPLAPQNPADPTNENVEVSRTFWATHALAR